MLMLSRQQGLGCSDELRGRRVHGAVGKVALRPISSRAAGLWRSLLKWTVACMPAQAKEFLWRSTFHFPLSL